MARPQVERVPLAYQRPSVEESLQRSLEFYHLMNRRRSVRHISDRSVPLDVIRNIILTGGIDLTLVKLSTSDSMTNDNSVSTTTGRHFAERGPHAAVDLRGGRRRRRQAQHPPHRRGRGGDQLQAAHGSVSFSIPMSDDGHLGVVLAFFVALPRAFFLSPGLDPGH